MATEIDTRRLTERGTSRALAAPLDLSVIQQLLARPRQRTLLDDLTPREQQVLALMAQGRSNQAICLQLSFGSKTVESHVRSIFDKLGLAESPRDHRRVLAVLRYLGDDELDDLLVGYAFPKRQDQAAVASSPWLHRAGLSRRRLRLRHCHECAPSSTS